MSETAPVLRYQGSNNKYVDIATRGGDETLGLSVQYAIHPTGVGCFIVRFIAHGEGIHPSKYKHLTYRESAKFYIPASKTSPHSEMFKGVRLNKVAIPALKPAVYKHEVAEQAAKLGLWPLLTEWIAEQVTAEGFTLTEGVNLQNEIMELACPKLPVTTETVESVIDFPNLDAPDQKKAALKLVQKPVDDEEDPDADLDDEDDDKDWLN